MRSRLGRLGSVRTATVSVAALLLALAACSGGQSKPAAGRAPRGLLAAMVLPQVALGPAAAALEKSGPSGALSNERRAASDLDALVTADSLAKRGRLSGYALQFGLDERHTSQALQRSSGLVKIGTLVESFTDEAAVAAAMTQTLDDLRRLTGKPLNVGGTLERVRTFHACGFRDRAVGLSLTVRLGGVPVYVTEVGFRVGRLAGIAVVTRADATDATGRVTALARRLELRIHRVLTGASLTA
jgi:hypothetical protein